MDPLSTLQTLYTIVKYLMKVSQQLKENGRECEKLCSHTEKVLNIIQQETRGNVSPSLGTKLDELARYELNTRPEATSNNIPK